MHSTASTQGGRRTSNRSRTPDAEDNDDDVVIVSEIPTDGGTRKGDDGSPRQPTSVPWQDIYESLCLDCQRRAINFDREFSLLLFETGEFFET